MNGVLKRAMAAWPIGLALAILLAAGPAGLAESSYNDRLPNGAVFGCDMCHDPETTFKTHFKNQGRLWTAALAAMDSDGDGSANGVELQDPSGTWQQGQANPGNPALVTNPGDGGSHPVATATPTRTPTRTPTALPPTATPTRTPTAVPPSFTPTPTPVGPTWVGICRRAGAWPTRSARRARSRSGWSSSMRPARS